MNRRHLFSVLAAFVLPALAGVSQISAQPASQPAPQAAPSASASSTAMKDQTVGEPKVMGNLTVFPIFSKKQVDVGPLSTLEDALAKGKAVVREIGDGHDGEGAQVNTLVIVNNGEVPIYVLAGTVVKGGRQDRQIGQDFIIDSKKTVPVDAFCVEHGRWTAQRDGRRTGGSFTATQQIVSSQVRAAGQYKKDQSEVWNKVAAANEAHHKSAPSGTYFATLDAPDVAQRRAALAQKVNAALTGAQPAADVVGFGWAIDGQVKGVRWFASHRVFELFRAQLVNGATIDALTAEAERNGAPAPAAAPVKAESVVQFVDDVDKARVTEQRDTAGGNVNEYRDSGRAYGSKTTLKPSPARPSAPRVPVSSDYLMH